MLGINVSMWLGFVSWQRWCASFALGAPGLIFSEFLFWILTLSAILGEIGHGNGGRAGRREAERQSARAQIDALGSQKLRLVSDRYWSETPDAIASYHDLDLQQARLELAYHLEYGEENDRWNHQQNVACARKHLAQAEAEAR